MSVVNQMLQELDRRRASAAERGSLPQHLLMLPLPMRTLTRRTLMLSAAVLASFLAVGGGFAWEQSRRAEPSATDAPLAPPASRSLPAQATVEPEAKSPAGEGGTQRDSIRAASTTQVEPVAPPPAVALEPRLKPATSLSIAASVRGSSIAAMRPPPAPLKAKAPPVSANREAEPVADTQIEKKVRSPSARERADSEYRRANAALAQGGAAEALPMLQQALREDPSHVEARLALARLLAEAGDGQGAADVLHAGAVSGAGNAEYRGLHAAVLQRVQRNAEAVAEYQAALRLMPGNAVWWMGLGLSLESAGSRGDARQAYLQARSAGTLSAELAAFVDQRLRQLP